MGLLELPTELVLAIAGHCADEADVSSLSRCCRLLHEQVTGALYQRNARSSYSSALRHAAMTGHDAGVALALRHGADVEASIDRCSKLPAAAARRVGELRRRVPGESTRECLSPLACAALYGHVGAARLLLDAGADVEAVDIFMNTPLFKAARSGNLELVRLLLDRGADAGARNADGETALWPAICSGNEELVGFLAGKKEGGGGGGGAGLDVNAEATTGSPLVLGATYWDSSTGSTMIEMLLDLGADMSHRNDLGRDALTETIMRGTLASAYVLLDEGAGVSNADNRGMTALSHAVRLRKLALVWRLVEQHGADVDARDTDGLTPLAQLTTGPPVDEEGLAMGARLLALGAHVDGGEHDLGNEAVMGSTPLAYAAYAGARAGANVPETHLKLATLLLEAGADPHARNRRGETPLSYAGESLMGDHMRRVMAELGSISRSSS
ncbi:ankyrin repeat-containing domain protein [Microdochium bolleyi]|uniref:Ankyrin repeat-containing domain protein n=1 Tax=Microdochium bolleyi TaxID=196109 RepID=A0A136JH98_9PEZI|nr:ankyrin repeat-containing domain protein [Microdochium bolleyi]